MHGPRWQLPCLIKRQHRLSHTQGTFPQFKGWLHHLCSSAFTPPTFRRRRSPWTGNALRGDLHAVVQIHNNSANFLSLPRLSQHTHGIVGFLLPLACWGHLQATLNDVLHQSEYDRESFIPAILICPHCLTVLRHSPAQESSDLLLISTWALITHTLPKVSFPWRYLKYSSSFSFHCQYRSNSGCVVTLLSRTHHHKYLCLSVTLWKVVCYV